MTEAARLHSTREVRRRIWQTLRAHFLPLMLALLLVSLPTIAAAVLDGMADEYQLQVEQERARLQELSQTPGWKDVPENTDVIIAAWLREGELESRASSLTLIAAVLEFTGILLAEPLLFGVNLVLICILRGGDFNWRDARITFPEFRRGMKLQCYLYILMAFHAIPGFLVYRFGQLLNSWRWNEIACCIILLLGMLLMCALPIAARMRYQLAPRLLADGAGGTSGELVAVSTEILDLRSLLPQLSILFPGLLMLQGAWLLYRFGLHPLMHQAVSGALLQLLCLPGSAYLLAGSAAIYTTFKS